MNKHKQSKSSVIFQTIWTNEGATSQEISDELALNGYDMPVKGKLKPMLQAYRRLGWLVKDKETGKWQVGPVAP